MRLASRASILLPLGLLALGACVMEDQDTIDDSGPVVEGDQRPGWSESNNRLCATPDVDVAEMQAIDDEVGTYLAAHKNDTVANATGGIIPVYWHVIRNGTGVANDSQLIATRGRSTEVPVAMPNNCVLDPRATVVVPMCRRFHAFSDMPSICVNDRSLGASSRSGGVARV